LTRRKLAKQLGIDEATLQRLEEDKPKHFAATARKVSAFLESLD
jgi:DNA-binding XRE family transcriptional regulator